MSLLPTEMEGEPPQFPMASQATAHYTAPHAVVVQRGCDEKPVGLVVEKRALEPPCSVERENTEMSAHRSLMAMATPLCRIGLMIGLLLSGIASADPTDGASSGPQPQTAPAERLLQPNPKQDLGSAQPTQLVNSDGAGAAVAKPAQRFAGLLFADASGSQAGANAAGGTGIVEKQEAPAAPLVLRAQPTEQRRAPFWNAQRGLGVAAAALGIVGIGISAWYGVQNGQPTGTMECSLGELPNQPCRYNTTDQFAFSLAASNLGLALGIALFSSAHL